MLQIQPDKDIIVEFIKNEDYKYAFLSLYRFLIGSICHPPPFISIQLIRYSFLFN
jgi:hypothetical protein